MEGLTTRVYKGVKGYWRRRRYQRLGTTTAPKRRTKWRIRISPRLKLRVSPKRLFAGVRDAYVRLMIKMANSPVVRCRTMSNGHDGEGFGTTARKEYDEKMIIEIYKTLAMRQGQLVTQQIPSQIACLV
ncbi:hypothetical protein Ccrd_003409 [Cynara cardunculus var. scolymus]|uniref:Uncharacterized protein n=1 Tax=Cynara cardunculus var. scolymus TaxID=59895 RepID=A0A118JWM6_CYNCS|nr:hypothetical protein Ccrd_003409 [Cynara cardunculus var. scolymus]